MTLSVEEAAGLLGVGRTKAYDMSREWRATNGESGLPVIDCRNTLRVPLHPLAEMLGVEVTELLTLVRAGAGVQEPAPAEPAQQSAPPPPAPLATPARVSRKRTTPTDQLDLFEQRPAS